MTSPGSAASSLSGGHGEGRELNMQKTCFYTALQWAKLGVLEAVKIFLVEIFSVNINTFTDITVIPRQNPGKTLLKEFIFNLHNKSSSLLPLRRTICTV